MKLPQPKRYLLPLLFLFSEASYAQTTVKPAVESFESEQVLSRYEKTNSRLSLSTQHRKFGQHSLAWEWHEPASFGTANFRVLARSESPLKYGEHFPASPSLSMSVYNETAQAGSVKISYEFAGKEQVWFEIPLNFQGWRQIWVPFYEMKGKLPKKGEAVQYDYFRISTTANQGKLFFDDIIFSQYQDDRHSYPDQIVPFIKTGQAAAEDHWMPLLRNLDALDRLSLISISSETKAQLQSIEMQIDKDLSRSTKNCFGNAKKTMTQLKLQTQSNSVVGPPLTFQLEQDYFDPAQQGEKEIIDIKDLGIALKAIATCRIQSSPSEQIELGNMFILGSHYFLDQGWQAGSSGGTRHHIGYKLRELTEAFYMMRQTLRQAGLLNDIGRSLQWLHNLGVIIGNDSDFHVNIDYLNTQAYFHLMLIFMSDNPERQAALLRAYSNYLSVTLAQENEEWGFKIDGTAWHHNGHYPAYGLGAFKAVPKIIRTLSASSFRLRKEAHTNFKKALLATRSYSQAYDFGFGNAGRHPFNELNTIQSLKSQFLDMALAGNPEGNTAIDQEFAAAYVRLWGQHEELSKLPNLSSEKLPGYLSFPYAATAIHRRDEWAALMKGYSKYVWSSEIYIDENRYGRYPANGTIELLNKQGEYASGYRQAGWDWNRFPGATIIYLPFKELEPALPLLMFRSNESFAGAVHLDGNGAFGMILNEEKGSNAEGAIAKIGFPGKLKAKKSVFSFGDKLICIGSNIYSVDSKNPTQTTLFQSALNTQQDTLLTSQQAVSAFPYQAELPISSDASRWLLDPYGNAYHILSNNPVHIKKETQQSYRNTYSIRTGKINANSKGVKETEGDFASAWIEHGFAPNNASYQYVIYPQIRAEQLQALKTVKPEQDYAILRADGVAHVAFDKTTSTTAYVVFEANQALKKGIVHSVSAPALLMVREDKDDAITLSVVQPDLNFEEKQKGKFINFSRPVRLQIHLQGKWNILNAPSTVQLDQGQNHTVINIECKDGLPTQFQLRKL